MTTMARYPKKNLEVKVFGKEVHGYTDDNYG